MKIKDELLPRLSRIDREVKNVNCGGCGIVAEAVYKFLRARGRKPRLVVYLEDLDDKRILKTFIQNNRYDADIAVHVVVKYGRYLIDSRGFISSREASLDQATCTTPVPLEFLEKWNQNEHGWNSRFKRHVYGQVIRKILLENL